MTQSLAICGICREFERAGTDLCAFLKVIPELGLCVYRHDTLSIEGGYIYPGDGAAHFSVRCPFLLVPPILLSE